MIGVLAPAYYARRVG